MPNWTNTMLISTANVFISQVCHAITFCYYEASYSGSPTGSLQIAGGITLHTSTASTNTPVCCLLLLFSPPPPPPVRSSLHPAALFCSPGLPGPILSRPPPRPLRNRGAGSLRTKETLRHLSFLPQFHSMAALLCQVWSSLPVTELASARTGRSRNCWRQVQPFKGPPVRGARAHLEHLAKQDNRGPTNNVPRCTSNQSVILQSQRVPSTLDPVSSFRPPSEDPDMTSCRCPAVSPSLLFCRLKVETVSTC